jgi:hypothetical protein
MYKIQQKHIYGFLAGVVIGVLGGLIGLGGAEFRLPLYRLEQVRFPGKPLLIIGM